MKLRTTFATRPAAQPAYDWAFWRRVSQHDDLVWQACARTTLAPLPNGRVTADPDPDDLGAKDPDLSGMKVAVACPHLRVGGGERTSTLLARDLRQFGAAVRLWTPDESEPDPVVAGWVADIEVMRGAVTWDPDVVIAWGDMPLPFGPSKRIFFANAPTVATARDLDKIAWAPDMIVGASAQCLPSVEANCRVIWNGADKVSPSARVPWPGPIGVVGRLSQQDKNIVGAALLSWMVQQPLLFWGDGPDAHLIDRALDGTGTVLVHPATPVAVAFGGIAVLLVPSIVEATPSVVAEAMRARIPVVSSPVGDLPTILADRRGALAESPAPEHLADALRRIGSIDLDEAERYADRYLSAEAMARQWGWAIREVVDR